MAAERNPRASRFTGTPALDACDVRCAHTIQPIRFYAAEQAGDMIRAQMCAILKYEGIRISAEASTSGSAQQHNLRLCGKQGQGESWNGLFRNPPNGGEGSEERA